MSIPESQALETFRAIPEALQPRAVHLLQIFGAYLQNERCGGMGVEGFPCGEPTRPCEECHEIWDLLERLETGASPSLPRIHPLLAAINE